jgi:hypothetical protein
MIPGSKAKHLENLFAATRGGRLTAADQARVAYAAAALDPESLLAHRLLGEALARLGDTEGARETFSHAARCARSERERRGLVEAWVKARGRTGSAVVGHGLVSLESLRAAGWNGVRHTVSLVTPTRTGRKVPCPRCSGQGDIAEYAHVQDGICFLCYGSRTIWEKRREL